MYEPIRNYIGESVFICDVDRVTTKYYDRVLMKIRAKTILVVLPLIITPTLFTGLISTLLARNGITSIATQFLMFKAEQVVTYANGQWNLLRDNDLHTIPEYRNAAVSAIETFAASVVRSDSESVFAVRENGALGFSAGRDVAGDSSLAGAEAVGWQRLRIAGVPRVAYAIPFEPLGWTVYAATDESAFYAATDQIIRQTAIVLIVSVVGALILLFFFAQYLTQPLRRMVTVIDEIITTNDLSRRVEVMYDDETGTLAHTFNVMTGQLEKAYDHIKSYALRAATARLKEQKTRTIFQRYVPNDVIEQFFRNPESMLVGENRMLAILFSDIRAFTTISERMSPNLLVESLNKYFSLMVEAVMNHHGTVDKYIGDAIMAIFGAPLRRPDDPTQAVEAAFDMLDALARFNHDQDERGYPEFKIGIGINYGLVTVGNIGTEKKLDYTVIGDPVNVASRLEGLTKRYDTPLIVSETVHERLPAGSYSRTLDRVQVKGRAGGVAIYAAARRLSERQKDAWALHDRGMELFFERDFNAALDHFRRVSATLPGDRVSEVMIERCRQLIADPPPADWTGEIAMLEK
ncbi:MAG: adenylate/guanylate cyclase domain-containing protein [Spirochaetaceae bacterium]|nr:MAG: adenylate/guanylate cyclase domain-containing protein [Spirochaetaceae bacterium]